jgi:protein-disulfide isomerase
MKKFLILFVLVGFSTLYAHEQPHSQPSTVQVLPEEIDDIVLGSAEAPLTLVEYSSINCVHCAQFHAQHFNHLKAKFIDTGKVRYVLKHFPLDHTAVDYMAIIATQPQEQWLPLLEVAYQHQKQWLGQPVEKLGEVLGLSKTECTAALTCEATRDKIIAKRFNAEQHLDIQATPTFHIIYVNGSTHKEEFLNQGLTPEALEKKLDAYLQ